MFLGYWHLVVNGDGHWCFLDDGCGCPCGAPLAGTASLGASGIRLRLALSLSSALGLFHLPGDWWLTANFLGYWHLGVNGDGHWTALDDGMWLSLWCPTDGYCLFEGVGDSSANGSFCPVPWDFFTCWGAGD